MAIIKNPSSVLGMPEAQYHKNPGEVLGLPSGQYLANPSSGSAPPLPTTGLILAVFGHIGVTYDGETGRVSDWVDQSGEGNDGAQSNSAVQPLRVAAQLDGKAIVRLDASNVFISRANLTGGSRGAACTSFLVAKKASNDAAHVLCRAGAADTYVIRTETTGAYGLQQGSVITGGTADTDWHTWCGVFDATDRLFIDDMTTGNHVVTGNAGTNTADGWSIGRVVSVSALCDVAAHLIYSTALTQDERNAVKAYIRSLYPSLPA